MASPSPAVFVQGQGAVTADNLNTFVQTVMSIAQLRTFTGKEYQVVVLQGTAIPGDGGQNTYYFNPTSQAPDNGSTVIAPTGLTAGRWIAIPSIQSTPLLAPQGRLTLVLGTPVMTSSITGASAIIYTPYLGNQVPIWNGIEFVNATFSETFQLLSDATYSPAPAGIQMIYDMFLWQNTQTGQNTQTNIVCTRGPAWATATSRGTGLGTSELTRVNGILVNKYDITHGPAAGYGVYVGSIRTSATGLCNYTLAAPGPGGVAGNYNVWNMYNRIQVTASVTDTSAAYNYTSATIRQSDGSLGNQVRYLDGLGEDGVIAAFSYTHATAAVTNARLVTGIGFNSVANFYNGRRNFVISPAVQTTTLSGTIVVLLPPTLGSNYVASLEGSDGTNANIFNAGADQTLSVIFKA